MELFRPSLIETSRAYVRAVQTGTQDEKMQEILTKVQDEFRSFRQTPKMDATQEIIFIGMNGYDTVWSDFNVLDVMSIDNYSAKRVAYTAAELNWNPNSEVCLMATNRIAKDLTAKDPLIVSCVLTSISSYLTEPLSQQIAGDVISMMTSSKPYIRQKAITLFYKICTTFPDALRNGFQTLKTCLDDKDKGVVFATLTVLHMLCLDTQHQFVPLIPQLHKMLTTSSINWERIRLIQILSLLNQAEPRLAKKLVSPFEQILQNSSSPNLIFEVVKSIIELNLTNANLITQATQVMENYVHHVDTNIRFLGLSYFLKLLQMQPKLITQYQDTINECLDSIDESMRLVALELLASLATHKTIDSVVAKMYDNIQLARTTAVKDQLIQKIIDICSNDDYKLVSDFDWYISVLMDIVKEKRISCYELLGAQFLDLAERVPSTRVRLTKEMCNILGGVSLNASEQLLLIASQIVGDYSKCSADNFAKLLQPIVCNFGPRIQASCLNSAFKIFLKSKTSKKRKDLEHTFLLKLPMFQMGCYLDVQDRAEGYGSLVEFLVTEEGQELFNILKEELTTEKDEELSDLEIPDDLNLPNPILEELDDEENLQDDHKETKDKKKKKHRKGEVKATVKKSKGKKEATKKSSKKPVRGPEQTSKQQILGKNAAIQVTVTQFKPHKENPNYIDVSLSIENLTSSVIEKVDIDYQRTGSVKAVSIDPTPQIEENGTISHTITFDVSVPTAPNVARVLFIPKCNIGEVLESRIRLLPSVFLVPGDKQKLKEAIEHAQKKEKITINQNSDSSPRDILQTVTNVLEASVLPNQDSHAKTLYSMNYLGHDVVSIVQFNDDNTVTIEISASDAGLAAALAKEVDLKLKTY